MRSLGKYLALLLVIVAVGYGLGYRRAWPRYQAVEGLRAELDTARAKAEENKALGTRLAELEQMVKLHGELLERTRERLALPADAAPVNEKARKLAQDMGLAVKSVGMAAALPGDLVREQPFSLDLRASAEELALFLEHLEALPGIIRINILEIQGTSDKDGRFDVHLSASAFSLAGG